MSGIEDEGQLAGTVSDVVRRLAIEIRSERTAYQYALVPLEKPWPQMSDEQKDTLLRQREDAVTLALRTQAFAEALAAVMGWPRAAALRDGMVQVLLELLDGEPVDGPLDVAGLKARVESSRTWTGL